MATRKKAATIKEEPPVSQNGKAAPHVLASLVPGTLTEAGAFVPRGSVQRVACDLFPGLDLGVYYRTNVAWRVVREDYEAEGATPVERQCRKLCAFIVAFDNFNFVDPVDGSPIPTPDPANWETFRPLVWQHGALTELGIWIVGRGLTLALSAPSKNS